MASFVRREERMLEILSQRRQRRRFRRENPLDNMDEDDIFMRFRFRKASILLLLGIIKPSIKRQTNRSNALTPLVQLLITLRFLACGAFYSVLADSMNVSKASVGPAIQRCIDAIIKLAPDYIFFPRDTDSMKQRFYKLAGFPNVVGAVDGTFIPITAPKQNDSDFLNRKGFYSINVQMTCDARFRITSCVAKWPGSVHDSRMFKESSLAHKFETGQYNGYLLGDSAYALKTYLLTPYLNPTTPEQISYNKAHAKTRVVIEQTYGILKRRFACLHYGLRVSAEKACKITLACATLHNFGIVQGDILSAEDENDTEIDLAQYQNLDQEDGKSTRNFVARHYFG